MNVRHPEGILHSFSFKKIFYDKMDLSLYFRVTIFRTLLNITMVFFLQINSPLSFTVFAKSSLQDI